MLYEVITLRVEEHEVLGGEGRGEADRLGGALQNQRTGLGNREVGAGQSCGSLRCLAAQVAVDSYNFV